MVSLQLWKVVCLPVGDLRVELIIIQTQKRIFYRKKMSHSKLKIEFHPRRISTSNSKEKYSPYRRKQKRSQNDDIFQQTRQKLTINEPLIRFKRQLESNSGKNKLKLTQDPQKGFSLPSPPTSYKQETGSTFGEVCPNCAHLAGKIEEQTAFLKQNFKEINNTLKLPKLSKVELEGRSVEEHEEYTQNQKIIIAYLDQIRNRREEGKDLEQAQEDLLKSNKRLREALTEVQNRNKFLEQELSNLKTLLADRQHFFQMLTDQKSTRSVAISSQSLQVSAKQQQQKEKDIGSSYKEQMKAIMTDIMERQNCDFQNIMKELQQIKLENDMLREELKLLNYAMTEKDAKIQTLKNQLVSFIQRSKRSNKESRAKSVKSSIKASNRKSSKRVLLKDLDVSIQCINDSEQKQEITITNKRTNSILITSRSNLLLERERLDLNNKKPVQLKESKMTKTVPFRLSMELPKKSTLMQQEDRFTLSKPMLKLKKQESTITKREKEMLEREKKELLCFSQDKLRDLDLVKRTLQHRFKGFKFTFHQLQAQMLIREEYHISYLQMDNILSSYPFSLQPYLRLRVLQYVLRQTEMARLKKMQIPSDLFCNRLRQLITDYEDIEEQQEMLLVQKLKKKVYMHFEGILNQCLKLEDRSGFVTEEYLKEVLEQFKLSKLEIEMFLNQCCLLSFDADHLDYKQYLSIFQNYQ